MKKNSSSNMKITGWRHLIYLITVFAWVCQYALAENDNSEINLIEKLEQWSRLRMECRLEIFKKIEMAKRDDTVDIVGLSKDIQTAIRYRLFDKSDIHSLIAIIDFPSSAKAPPVVTEITGGLATPDPLQTPIARALTDLGTDSADGCLEVLSRKKTVAVSERQMWLVILKAYPKDALAKLENKLGSDNPVFIQLKKEMETGPPEIILYR